MPSKRPKVSAYVPQHIFNYIKAFADERKLTVSQAATLVFAEYFQVDYQVNQSGSLVGTESLARIEALEEQIRNLPFTDNSLLSSLPSKLQLLESLVAQIESRLSSLEAKQSGELLGKPLKQYTDILLEVAEQEDDSIKQLNMLDHVDTPPDDLRLTDSHQAENDLTINEPQVDQNSSLPIEFSTKQLCMRLGVSSGAIAQQRFQCKDDKEKFFDWVQSKDIDKIRWIESGLKGRSPMYEPAIDTPSELLSRLRDWIENNL